MLDKHAWIEVGSSVMLIGSVQAQLSAAIAELDAASSSLTEAHLSFSPDFSSDPPQPPEPVVVAAEQRAAAAETALENAQNAFIAGPDVPPAEKVNVLNVMKGEVESDLASPHSSYAWRMTFYGDHVAKRQAAYDADPTDAVAISHLQTWIGLRDQALAESVAEIQHLDGVLADINQKIALYTSQIPV